MNSEIEIRMHIIYFLQVLLLERQEQTDIPVQNNIEINIFHRSVRSSEFYRVVSVVSHSHLIELIEQLKTAWAARNSRIFKHKP